MSLQHPNVCVVGVGAVGLELLRLLKSRQFPLSKLTVLARSSRTLDLDGDSYEVRAISPEAFAGQDIVLFAGTEGEKGAAVTFAPKAIDQGAVCIDNGADFRLDEKVPLVVPEINSEDLKNHQNLVANPNCSTIQMVLALAPLQRAVGIRQVVVSTYQAVSGAGRQAIEDLKNHSRQQLAGGPPSEKETAFNAIPQIGPFQEKGYSSEEWKMVKETQKILHAPNLKINATTVRIPVINGHSESIYVELEKPLSPEQAKELFRQQAGLKVVDDSEGYPVPVAADGQDEVFVGRIRQDASNPNALALWVVSDNLRKGAALNALQIAETLVQTDGA